MVVGYVLKNTLSGCWVCSGETLAENLGKIEFEEGADCRCAECPGVDVVGPKLARKVNRG